MHHRPALLARLRRDERGASLVEYGVALLVVVTVGVGGIIYLGDATGAQIGEAQDTVSQ